MWLLLLRNNFFSVALILTVTALIVVPLEARTLARWSSQIHEIHRNKATNELRIKNFEKQLNLFQGGFHEKSKKLFTVRPTEDRLVTVLNTIDAIALESGLRKFELRNIDDAHKENTVHYRAIFEGTPQTTMKFLIDLEDLQHYIQINAFSVEALEKATLSDAFNASLSFSLFIR
jgi:hypothetical protein